MYLSFLDKLLIVLQGQPRKIPIGQVGLVGSVGLDGLVGL